MPVKVMLAQGRSRSRVTLARLSASASIWAASNDPGLFGSFSNALDQLAWSARHKFMKYSTRFDTVFPGWRPLRRSSTNLGSRTDSRPNLVHAMSVSFKNISIFRNNGTGNLLLVDRHAEWRLVEQGNSYLKSDFLHV